MPHPRHDFAAYAEANRFRLVIAAHLLCGEPRGATELAHGTLVRVCARWRRIPRDDVDFHVRRALVRGYLRRTYRQKSVVHGELARLSVRQRAVLVLRYWEGLEEVETAQVLGWSAGAVESRARRGLAICGGRERVGELFTEAATRAAAYGDVPLGALGGVERRGRALRRRRVGAVALGCALLLVPPGLVVAERVGGFGGVGAVDGAARVGGVAPGPIRVLAPGERVEPVPGLKVWLTSDGEHWSTPRGAEPLQEGGSGARVSLRAELVDGDVYFVTGGYSGLTGDPRRVEVSVGGSVVTGMVLTLAGGPGWGVWYLEKPLTARELKASSATGELVVTVYDAGGRAVARSGGGE
ncbi:hypothetical protein IAG44_18830 [Streptomyces roseirectus]|uniref:RNA polymerase sigma factor 70 region 4 type 2 domain-containing protein n=1 Tax=Streptomyces roseirectus TaxID=2768066 RepID=A0A7H0IES1_9ACTN|nr:sigma factor-like helix-turn-helix DNA-binding protein [Streptomyces roseirectus]QNP71287.1 hypothetical protein IAG44_18830 [Streptomyces roseirectus]